MNSPAAASKKGLACLELCNSRTKSYEFVSDLCSKHDCCHLTGSRMLFSTSSVIAETAALMMTI